MSRLKSNENVQRPFRTPRATSIRIKSNTVKTPTPTAPYHPPAVAELRLGDKVPISWPNGASVTGIRKWPNRPSEIGIAKSGCRHSMRSLMAARAESW